MAKRGMGVRGFSTLTLGLHTLVEALLPRQLDFCNFGSQLFLQIPLSVDHIHDTVYIPSVPVLEINNNRWIQRTGRTRLNSAILMAALIVGSSLLLGN